MKLSSFHNLLWKPAFTDSILSQVPHCIHSKIWSIYGGTMTWCFTICLIKRCLQPTFAFMWRVFIKLLSQIPAPSYLYVTSSPCPPLMWIEPESVLELLAVEPPKLRGKKFQIVGLQRGGLMGSQERSKFWLDTLAIVVVPLKCIPPLLVSLNLLDLLAAMASEWKFLQLWTVFYPKFFQWREE